MGNFGYHTLSSVIEHADGGSDRTEMGKGKWMENPGAVAAAGGFGVEPEDTHPAAGFKIGCG